VHEKSVNYVDTKRLLHTNSALEKNYILLSTSISGGALFVNAEKGNQWVIDPTTLDYWEYSYWSIGPGINASGVPSFSISAQFETGIITMRHDPKLLNDHSVVVNGFASAGPAGISGQISYTFSNSKDIGNAGFSSFGWAPGLGAGLSIMYSNSTYLKTGNLTNSLDESTQKIKTLLSEFVHE
jgi:hypothetical protein